MFFILIYRKDANGFFAFPVTENIAPGYYSIISQPMDFSTMKTKILNGEYRSVAEYKVCLADLYCSVSHCYVVDENNFSNFSGIDNN